MKEGKMVSTSSLQPFSKLAAPVKALMRRSPRLNAIVWNAQYRLGMWNYMDSEDGAQVLMLVERYFKKPSILDLGCGTSANLRLIADRYQHYHGVDISANAIEHARALGRPNASFEVADILTYETNEIYDAILLREVIYYIPAQKVSKFLWRIAGLLSPEGNIIIKIWNTNSFAEFVDVIRNSGLRVLEEQAARLNEGPEGIFIVLGMPESKPGLRRVPDLAATSVQGAENK
jgi:SAM-dependent methyltransferase